MAEPDPETLAHAAAEVAREAGALIRSRFAAPRVVRTKSVAVDLVTDTDHAAERLILERLGAKFPGHAILSEEAGFVSPSVASGHDESVCWVIDPLDGTTNFAHGVPHFAVSIAAVAGSAGPTPLADPRRTRLLAGAVYDPMRDELFSASADGPALLGGHPISVSSAPVLAESLLATGFPYDRREQTDAYLAFWRKLLVCARDVRRMGAAALDLAWVACGRFDAFWESKLHPWDVAAGALLVRRAGGKVSDFADIELPLEASQTLASNGRIHSELVAAIASRF